MGTGKPYREFLHVDDMAFAAVFVMNLLYREFSRVVEPMQSHINIGCGRDYQIREVVSMIAEIVNYQGGVQFDSSKPDGTMRKLLDVTKINGIGWTSAIEIFSSLTDTYRWYLGKRSVNYT